MITKKYWKSLSLLVYRSSLDPFVVSEFRKEIPYFFRNSTPKSV